MAKINIKTCPSCKRLFESMFDRELCPECYSRMEAKFDVVRKYIRSTPKADVNAVSEHCGVPKRQILRWVREERLFFDKESNMGVPCLNCGIIIQTGKYCDSCKATIAKDLKGVYVKPTAKEDDIKVNAQGKNKMRYLNKEK